MSNLRPFPLTAVAFGHHPEIEPEPLDAALEARAEREIRPLAAPVDNSDLFFNAGMQRQWLPQPPSFVSKSLPALLGEDEQLPELVASGPADRA